MQQTSGKSYTGTATGALICEAISRDPLSITRGVIRLFTVDPDVSDAVNLLYDLDLLGTNGEVYHLHGFKRIDPRITLSPSKTWAATTTLFTTIDRRDKSGIARGILRLSMRGFIDQVLSLRCPHTLGLHGQIHERIKFLEFFARNLASYVFSPARPLEHCDTQLAIGINEKATPRETWITSGDGVRFCVKCWNPPTRMVPKLTPIVMIPGAGVDEQVFSLPAISTNTIDYFTSHGYRCYVPVLRFGNPDEAKTGWTVFDARLDKARSG
ncbi:hypothetical protein NX059_011125 [Plenodomus lindquistii]|nr:hypothetical protein NX059_011125 [Plenodomus lindquistii]